MFDNVIYHFLWINYCFCTTWIRYKEYNCSCQSLEGKKMRKLAFKNVYFIHTFSFDIWRKVFIMIYSVAIRRLHKARWLCDFQCSMNENRVFSWWCVVMKVHNNRKFNSFRHFDESNTSTGFGKKNKVETCEYSHNCCDVCFN